MSNKGILDYELDILLHPNNIDKVWDEIKHNDVLLYNAIKVIKVKSNGEMVDAFYAPLIVELIITDRYSVDDKLFRSTLDIIYSNKDIARTVGYIGATTYLLKTFFDEKLILTKRQKEFAVNEAIEAYMEDPHYKKLVPSHRSSGFDLREYILLNSNWTDEEKKELAYKFYLHDSVHFNRIQKLIYSVYNNKVNYIDNGNGKKVNSLDFNKFFYYTLEELTSYYGDKEIAEEMYKRIRTLETLMMTSPSIYLEELKQKELIKK